MTSSAPSLMAHAAWPHVAPLLTVEAGTRLASGNVHRRIELESAGLSERQLRMLLTVRVACASCGAGVCPFRQRLRSSAGRTQRPGRLYVSFTCPLDVSLACARGKAASDAAEALAKAIADHRRAPTPPQAEAHHQLRLRLRGAL